MARGSGPDGSAPPDGGFFESSPPLRRDASPKAAPHHDGHRDRLRERFEQAGAQALADYELLEFMEAAQ